VSGRGHGLGGRKAGGGGSGRGSIKWGMVWLGTGPIWAGIVLGKYICSFPFLVN
jgi:hypothetical protein